jgi:enoyl-CoA hydratase/carnithine racemase
VVQVEIERDGAVMIVTLNRPHRKNAMTLTMMVGATRSSRRSDGTACAPTSW